MRMRFWISVLLVLAFTLASAGVFAGGAKEAVTIRAATQKHPAIDALKELLPLFQKQTGITVEINDLPQDQLNGKVELSLASGTGEWDIVMMDHMRIPRYVKAGWIESLTPYIGDPRLTDAKSFAYDDILKGFVNAASVNGKLYAMPFYGESTMLMYNKEMFQAAGIMAPPKNMQELGEDAKKLTNADKKQYGIAMRGARSINWYPWSGFAYAFGGGWLGSDGKPDFNSPENIQATDLFAKLIRDYGPPGAANFDWNDVQISMQQGTVAMIIDATNFGPRLENSKDSIVVGKVGYAMVPGRAKGFIP